MLNTWLANRRKRRLEAAKAELAEYEEVNDRFIESKPIENAALLAWHLERKPDERRKILGRFLTEVSADYRDKNKDSLAAVRERLVEANLGDLDTVLVDWAILKNLTLVGIYRYRGSSFDESAIAYLSRATEIACLYKPSHTILEFFLRCLRESNVHPKSVSVRTAYECAVRLAERRKDILTLGGEQQFPGLTDAELEAWRTLLLANGDLYPAYAIEERLAVPSTKH